MSLPDSSECLDCGLRLFGCLWSIHVSGCDFKVADLFFLFLAKLQDNTAIWAFAERPVDGFTGNHWAQAAGFSGGPLTLN